MKSRRLPDAWPGRASKYMETLFESHEARFREHARRVPYDHLVAVVRQLQLAHPTRPTGKALASRFAHRNATSWRSVRLWLENEDPLFVCWLIEQGIQYGARHRGVSRVEVLRWFTDRYDGKARKAPVELHLGRQA